MAAVLIGSSATGAAATVLTLEGGLLGLQPFFHFTPENLRGEYCTGSYSCMPVDYFALPVNHTAMVTYVWVPTDTLPLVAWTGPFAPALDNMLRPIVDKAYTGRPAIPDPTPPATESNVIAGRTDVTAVDVTNADLSVAASPEVVEHKKDSAGRASGATNRTGGAARPVRGAIATVKKAVDRTRSHPFGC